MNYMPLVQHARSHDEAEAIERRHVAAMLRKLREHIDAQPVAHVSNVEMQSLLRTLENEAWFMQEKAEELERECAHADPAFEAWVNAGASPAHPDYEQLRVAGRAGIEAEVVR